MLLCLSEPACVCVTDVMSLARLGENTSEDSDVIIMSTMYFI